MKKGTEEKRKRIRREKRKEREKEYFPAFWRSKFDNPKTKFGARSLIYVWIPKSWSFDKLHKVGYFPTQFIFSLKAL